MIDNGDEPVTKKEFNNFLSQHFWHLKRDVTFIKGQLWVIIPLVLCLLGAMITVLLRNIF